MRALSRLPALLLVHVLVVACQAPVVPAGARVLCASDAECPGGLRCDLVDGSCFADAGADADDPGLLRAEVTPALLPAGGTLTVTVIADEALARPPTARLVVGGESVLSLPPPVFDGDAFVFSFTIGASEVERGLDGREVDVTIGLVDLVRRSADVVAGAVVVDLTPPVAAPTLVTPEGTVAATPATPLTVAGAVSEGAVVERARLIDPATNDEIDVTSAVSVADGALVGALVASLLPGTHEAIQLAVTLRDDAGNLGEEARSDAIALRASPPEVRAAAILEEREGLVQTRDVTLAVVADRTAVAVAIGGPATVVGDAPDGDGFVTLPPDGELTLRLDDLAAGAATLTVRARDDAGQVGTTSSLPFFFVPATGLVCAAGTADVDGDPRTLCECAVPVGGCAFAGAETRCVAGSCAPGACLDGFVDLDGNPQNGCEYACAGAVAGLAPSLVDAFDDDAIDSNCDGSDGLLDDGVFLDGDADPGVTPDGTPGRPFSSLVPAMQAARSAGKHAVYLFDTVVNLPQDEPIALLPDVGLVGGFSRLPDGRVARVPGRSTVVRVASTTLVSGLGLAVEGSSALELRGLTVVSAATPSPGQDVIGLHLDSAGTVVVAQTSIFVGSAGAGAAGLAGLAGQAGAATFEGRDGAATFAQVCAIGGLQERTRGGAGGTGDGSSGGVSGSGAAGGRVDPDSGADLVVPVAGVDGVDGVDGLPGWRGVVAPTVLGGDVRGVVAARAGTTGTSGSGGGGGGGFVDSSGIVAVFKDGGHGGQGGCAGDRGTPGGPAGAAIGVLLNGSTRLQLRPGALVVVGPPASQGRGGAGGAGGARGRGALGGSASGSGTTSAPGDPVEIAPRGQTGADGGAGGRGGSGGDGGHGLTAGILRFGAATLDDEGARFLLGVDNTPPPFVPEARPLPFPPVTLGVASAASVTAGCIPMHLGGVNAVFCPDGLTRDAADARCAAQDPVGDPTRLDRTPRPTLPLQDVEVESLDRVRRSAVAAGLMPANRPVWIGLRAQGDVFVDADGEAPRHELAQGLSTRDGDCVVQDAAGKWTPVACTSTAATVCAVSLRF